MTRLQSILASKQKEIAKLLPRSDLLRAAALQRNDYRGFASAIHRGPDALGLIAEVKKASPSVGLIAPHFDPVAIAQSYAAAGAHALSVLTDAPFFQGSLHDLTLVRRAVSLPILRKDFILHPAQIYEAAVAGADAILLIVAALEPDALQSLHLTAADLGLDVLVEVHSLPELETALDTEATLIGINNRNLATFEVDLSTTEQLSQEVPEGITLVGESGIRTAADAKRMADCGVNALLVGETLMRAENVASKISELLSL